MFHLGRVYWPLVALTAVLTACCASRGQVADADGVRAIGVKIEAVQNTAPEGNAALFVGVNQFRVDSGLSPLRFAVDDAVAQAHLFVLDLKLIPADNCWLCLGGDPSTEQAKALLRDLEAVHVRRGDADHTSVLQAMSRVARVCRGPADLLIVSIASHGFEESGIPYAMPSDGSREFLGDTAVNLAHLEQRLSESKAGKRLLVLDACRDKAFAGQRGVGVQPMNDKFRDELAKAEGQAVLASCDAGQVSYENEKLGHGLFTYFLLKALEGEAKADERGMITLSAVSDYVSRQVPAWALQNQDGAVSTETQKPWFKGPLEAGEIPLAMDSRIRQRIAGFPENVARAIDALKPKIEVDGGFDAALFARVAAVLQKLDARNAKDREMLDVCRDFADGRTRTGPFIAYLNQILQTREQPAARIAPAPDAAAEVAAEAIRQRRVADLLSSATADFSGGKRNHALASLEELLKLDPANARGLTLRNKIEDSSRGTFENSIGMTLVEIKPGSFMMGSPERENGRIIDEKIHKVTLTHAFYMQTTPVTQAQYWSVMDHQNPSWFQHPRLEAPSEQRPVETVCWIDAVEFCRRLSQKDGKHYRLPTEAEWEYACRARTQTAYWFGDHPAALPEHGWIDLNSSNCTHPVGEKGANPWGLYDMHGNVWQWCADSYGLYRSGDVVDPKGPNDSALHVMRGGSWNNDPRCCRSAYRGRGAPGRRSVNVGFRVVMDF